MRWSALLLDKLLLPILRFSALSADATIYTLFFMHSTVSMPCYRHNGACATRYLYHFNDSIDFGAS